MLNIDIVRPYATEGLSTSLALSTGYVSTTAGDIYLPLTIDEFTAPDITITGAAGDLGASTITAGTAGDFDNLREGDIISSTSVGALAAPASVIRDCIVAEGLNYVIYESMLTPGNLGVSAGDAVSGTGVGAGAKVDKIDYEGRRIFLTADSTADGVGITLTFQPDIKVTAVRSSTATSNANQIDVNTTISTALVASEVVVTPGVSEAILAVIQLTPTGSTTNGRAKFSVSAAYPDPKLLAASMDGVYSGDVSSLNYVNIGTYTVDLDQFLVDARVPRPTV